MIKISKNNNKKTRFFEHSKVLNIILIILAFSLAVSFLSRLNFKKEESHFHTFSEIWFCNSIAHWRVATCEHKSEKIDYSGHIGTLDDCECDVCGYVNHVGMSDDCRCDVCGYVNHIGMSDDCECDVCGYVEHIGMSDDCECDVCGYIEHTYSSVYTYGSSGHWYESTCSHTGIRKDYTLHEYDENNYCIHCGRKYSTGVELPVLPI